MMASPEVWPAMAHAFEAATGSLARRLRRRAARRRGARRRRARAPVVRAAGRARAWRGPGSARSTCASTTTPSRWPSSTACWTSADAYALATEGDELVGQGRHEEAGERYRSASALAPGNHELLFWAGLAAAQAGDLPTALERVREAIRLQPGWRELLGRLDAEIAPGAPALLRGAGGRRRGVTNRLAHGDCCVRNYSATLLRRQ